MRPFVRVARRCSRCLLSERYTDLQDGVCAVCRSQVVGAEPVDGTAAAADQQVFDQVIRSHVVEGHRHHALLLLSGGKDSAYILDRLRREHPALRILCVAVDNGFMSPGALDGARQVAVRAGCDLLEIHAETGRFAQALRTAFLELKGRGAYGVVDKADGDLIFEIGREVAAEQGIPLMLGGLSWVQLQRIFNVDDFRMQRRPGLLELYPLAAWRTDEREILAAVRAARLLPPGCESPIVSNNELILAMSAIDVLNLGYCSFEPEFAQLVREGKTDRKTWLHAFELLEFATLRGFLDDQVGKGLARLDLTMNDVLRRRI